MAKPPVEFPLCRSVIMHRVHYYYAIGNTAARNLLVRYSDSSFSTSNEYNVLCLGCGDFRHCLYSLAGLLPEDGEDRKMKHLPAGETVEILGLVGAAHLNGRMGTVARFLKEKGRYQVKLIQGGTSEDGSVLVKRDNLKLSGEISEGQVPSIRFFINDFDPHVIARNLLLLECLLDDKVPVETSFAIWFSLGLTEAQLAVLTEKLRCLLDKHSGDKKGSGARYISFHNDCDESRNKVVDVWEKWLDFCGKGKGQRKPLPLHQEVLRMRRNVVGLRLRQLESGQQKKQVMTMLMEQMFGGMSSMQERAKVNISEKEFSKLLEGMVLSQQFRWDEVLLTESAKKVREVRSKEVRCHLEAGNFNVSAANEEITCTNPTLFWRSDAFDLHYGTNAFDAFPLFPPDPQEKLSLLQLCFREFQTWVSALRTQCCKNRVAWKLSTADCRQLPFCCPGNETLTGFDVITTSNVADHMGLLNLLAVCRPLLRDYGVLYTTSLLWSRHGKSGLEYVQHEFAQRCLPLDEWPHFLGLRLMGCEAAVVRPVSSTFQSEEVSALRALMQQVKGGEFLGNRELTLEWIALPRATYTLVGDAASLQHRLYYTPNAGKHSHRTYTILHTIQQMMQALHDAGTDLVFTHCSSILPHLSHLLAPQDIRGISVLTPSTTKEWHVLTDLLLCDSADELAKIVGLYSVTVSYAVLDSWKLEMQPLVYVQLVCEQSSGSEKSTVEYHGTWYSCDHNQEEVTVFFYASRRYMMSSTRTTANLRSARFGDLLVASALKINEHQLSYENVNSIRAFYGYAELLQSAEGNITNMTSSEEGEVVMDIIHDKGNEVHFLLTGKMLTKKLKVRRQEGALDPCRFEVLLQGDAQTKSASVLLSFIYSSAPLDLEKKVAIHEEQSSATGVGSVLLKFHKRPFQGVVRHFTELDFARMQFCYSKQGMVTASGSQFNEEERYISRSRDSAQLPPLIALKDSFMFLYQCCEERMFNIFQDGQGCVAIIMHHGLVTNRHTSIPWVDVSVCLLTHEIVHIVAPASVRLQQKLSQDGVEHFRSIKMEQNEYELFQQVLEVFQLQSLIPKTSGSVMLLKHGCSTGLSTGVRAASTVTGVPEKILRAVREEHPELRTFFEEESVRKHFRRVFIGPLYAPLFEATQLDADAKKFMGTSSAVSSKNETLLMAVRKAKEQGNVCFQKQEWDAAIGYYKQAVRPLSSTTHSQPSAENERSSVAFEFTAAYSNMSQCFLRKRDFREALFAADMAIEQLAGCSAGENASRLGRKAWQRKALAHEGLGEIKKMEDAQKQGVEFTK